MVIHLGGLFSGGEANRHLFERMQEYIEKRVLVLDKFHMMKYINKATNQMLDEAGEAKGRLWKAV